MATPTVYEIRVEGKLDVHWSDWFSGLSVMEVGEDETLIKGSVADQAALRGLLEKIWNLNLTLVSVQRL